MANLAGPIFTFVGYAIWGPAGALIGSFLASALFPPPPVKGPRLRELDFQRSTVGAPIPIVFGTAALAGNVIFSGGLIETKHSKEVGGFLGFGGQEIDSYTYSVDVAVGICEGEITAVRRIWADADLIFDASDDATLEERIAQGGGDSGLFGSLFNAIRAMSAQLDFTLYLGTEDQLPDPTIESYKPPGQVPAYRGLAYIVFNRFELAKYGNRIPSFRFEVTTSGTPTECGLYSAGNLYPWIEGTIDPRNDLNVHEYSGDGGTTWYSTLSEAVGDLSLSYAGGVRNQFYSDPLWGWNVDGVAHQPMNTCDPVASGNKINLFMFVNSLQVTNASCDALPAILPTFCEQFETAFGHETVVHWTGIYGGGQNGTGYWVRTAVGVSETAYFEGQWQPGSGLCNDGGTIQYLLDAAIRVRRSRSPPDPCLYGTPLVGAPGYCVVDGEVTQGITWTQVAGTFHVLQAYDEDGSHQFVTAYPVGPAVISTSPLYNDAAYWTAAYAADQASGDPRLPGGLVYGVDYPQAQSFAYFSECDTLDVACVPMATVVSALCARAGLRTDSATQIDVTDLTTCVPGFIVGSVMSARDAMVPLRTFGLWDCVESADDSGGILKFIERGHALKATLTADDLGAHDPNSDAPPSVEVTRIQEKDLPRRVRVHFPNLEHDHEVSEQSASRITTEAVSEIDVELPVSMDPDSAKQLAEILLYEQEVARDGYTFALDHTWLELEPSDCIEIPVDGETERVRITSVQYSLAGVLNITALRDDDGSYVSTAVAGDAEPSGGPLVPGGSGPVCPSVAVLVDIPAMRHADTLDAGYWAAIYGLCPDSWACADLYRSSDGGLTYGRIARTDQQATVGAISEITGPATDATLPGDSPPYDSANTITVALYNDNELATITDAQIEAGLNKAAIGVDGRWVIVQFLTATLTTTATYELTDIIWGLHDTEHLLGTTVSGDTFVLLSDPAILRIAESPTAIGQEKQFKVPTCGEALDDVSSFPFTTWGLSYQRLCPSEVLSATITEPPVSPADGDAYLLPNDTSLTGVWATHGGEIAKWSDETGSWVYCTPAPGTVVHITEGEATDGSGGEDVISGGDGTYTPASWARADATFVTVDDETLALPNSRQATAGVGIAITASTDGELEFSARIVGVDGVVVTPNTDGELEVSVDPDAVGDPDATYLTLTDESASLPGSYQLTTSQDEVQLTTDTSGGTVDLTVNRGIPQNHQAGNHTITGTDNGRSIDHLSGDGASDVYTIPSNAGNPLEIGFTFTVCNLDSNSLQVQITSDTLYRLPGGTTGTITVAQYGIVTCRKVDTTKWIGIGAGLS